MNNFKPKKGTPCVLYDRLCTECGECMMCDLDPKKVCDNCGKCLEAMMPEMNKKGFVEIPVEFDQDADNADEDTQDSLKEFLRAYGLADVPQTQDECDDECDCEDEECHCHDHEHKHNHECDCEECDHEHKHINKNYNCGKQKSKK